MDAGQARQLRITLSVSDMGARGPEEAVRRVGEQLSASVYPADSLHSAISIATESASSPVVTKPAGGSIPSHLYMASGFSR